MSEATIRPMTEQDYDAVRALWLTIRGFGIRALDDSREDVVRFIRRNPTTSVVAEADGKIVGSILCGSDGRQGALYHVCVAKAYRRQGIGTRMVGYCERNGHQQSGFDRFHQQRGRQRFLEADRLEKERRELL